jgi:hypothetical protein
MADQEQLRTFGLRSKPRIRVDGQVFHALSHTITDLYTTAVAAAKHAIP